MREPHSPATPPAIVLVSQIEHRGGKRVSEQLIPANERCWQKRLDAMFVAHEVYGEDILFTPIPMLETIRVIPRQINIVNVDYNSRLYPWQDIDHKYRNVRIHEDPMRAIEKQDIPRL
jgi:hypothetical protein